MGSDLTGREELARAFRRSGGGLSDTRDQADVQFFTDGTWICFEGRFTGPHTGIFHGHDIEMPPTGKSIDSPYVWVAEVRDGKITSARIYYDRLKKTLEQRIKSVSRSLHC